MDTHADTGPPETPALLPDFRGHPLGKPDEATAAVVRRLRKTAAASVPVAAFQSSI